MTFVFGQLELVLTITVNS